MRTRIVPGYLSEVTRDLVAVLDRDPGGVGERVVLAAPVGADLAHDAQVRGAGSRARHRQQVGRR